MSHEFFEPIGCSNCDAEHDGNGERGWYMNHTEEGDCVMAETQRFKKEVVDDAIKTAESAEYPTRAISVVLAAEVRAMREDINSGEYFRLKKENVELKASLAALQSDYNAYAVLAKSVRDGLNGEIAALKSNDAIAAPYRHIACIARIEQLEQELAAMKAKYDTMHDARHAEAREVDRLKRELAFDVELQQDILARDRAIAVKDDELLRIAHNADHPELYPRLQVIDDAKKAAAVGWRDFLDKEKAG